jgi:mRNA interferase RelE/StbE
VPRYRVEIADRALKEAMALPADVRKRLVQTMDDLAADPRPPAAKRLTGHPGYRVRKGDYRILYTIDETAQVIRIYRLGHRKDIYRRLR